MEYSIRSENAGPGQSLASRVPAPLPEDPVDLVVGRLRARPHDHPVDVDVRRPGGDPRDAVSDVLRRQPCLEAGSDADLVISATPIDLTRVITVTKPMQRVRYELQEIGYPTLEDVLKEKFAK